MAVVSPVLGGEQAGEYDAYGIGVIDIEQPVVQRIRASLPVGMALDEELRAPLRLSCATEP